MVSGKATRATGVAPFIFQGYTSTTGTGWTTCATDKGNASMLMALCMMVTGKVMKGGVSLRDVITGEKIGSVRACVFVSYVCSFFIIFYREVKYEDERFTLREGMVTESFRARMMSTKAIGNIMSKTGTELPSLHQAVDIKDSGRWARRRETGSACIRMGACICFAAAVVCGLKGGATDLYYILFSTRNPAGLFTKVSG